MFWTVAHLSTPFWCFAVLESSSHPPVHNLLCAHRTEMASVRREKHVFFNNTTNKHICTLPGYIEETYYLTVGIISQYHFIKNKPFAQGTVMLN